VRLDHLIRLIDREAELSAQIKSEIRKWATVKDGQTALRMGLRGFGLGSLRQNAKALGVSATYLSQCERGKMMPSRSLMKKLHNTFGTGRK
jgi:ribosome-binding protein aMBF1 (putative translation factor)